MMNETNDNIDDLLVPNGYFVNFRGGKEQPKNAGDGDNPLIGSGGSFGFIDDFNHSGNGVIFGRKGTINKPFPINGQFWMIDTAYFAVPDSHYLEPRYYSYWAETVPFDQFMTNTARPSTTAHALARQKIPLYPLSEQERIADYLDVETAEIDRMVTHLDELIEELEARNQAISTDLIFQHGIPSTPSSSAEYSDLGYDTAIRIDAVVSQRKIQNEDQKAQYLSLMKNVGVITYEEKGDVGNKKPEDLTRTIGIRKGDFVVNSMNFGIGSYGISPYDGVGSKVYLVFQPRVDRLSPNYLRHLFRNDEFRQRIQDLGNGILEHRKSVKWETFGQVRIPLPSLDEQHRIADYLDTETARIDKMKTTATDLRAELLARRKSLITEVVTGQKRMG